MDKHTTERLYAKGALSFLDIRFAEMMAKLDNSDNPVIFLSSALVSSHTRLGQVCVDIRRMAGKPLFAGEPDGDDIRCPDIDTWIHILEKSRIVGRPGDFKPLIMDPGSRLLYLHRYFQYQEEVIRFMASKCADVAAVDHAVFREGLNRLFPEAGPPGDINRQKIAAITACLKKICIISGGPGTGKTTTVVRILSLVLEQAQTESFTIALLAPTGKAAMRLRESIRNAVEKLDCPEHIKAKIPHETATIHRFLGTIQGSPYFRHNEKNPLNVDMVIVDESSMVDLALMAKLLKALPANASLVLLGDKDQLASVETGAVFGDLCNSGDSSAFSKTFTDIIQSLAPDEVALPAPSQTITPITDCLVHLRKSYRFGKNSGIGAVSRAVNTGDGKQAMNILKNSDFQDIEWHELPPSKTLPEKLETLVRHLFQNYLASRDPRTALKTFDGFRILCALREGPYGVKSVNMLIKNILAKERRMTMASEWYALRPVMMTGNNYQLQLFNGDIGIAFPDRDDNHRLKVYFSGMDDEHLRGFYPDGLSEHESVYAMTVHKSQGSEFDNTVLILPDQDSQVLTRELLYTGMTRTRKKMVVWGREDVFLKAVSRNISRTSGLVNALSGLRDD